MFKKFLAMILFLFSMTCFAYQSSYTVSGVDQNGTEYHGTFNVSSDSDSVTGELVDEDGNHHSFSGQKKGAGKFGGTIDTGMWLDLTSSN